MMYSIKMRASNGNRHISGAEGIFDINELAERGALFISRAMNHGKGMPDRVNLKIESLTSLPLSLKTLPLHTCHVKNNLEAGEEIVAILGSLGIDENVISKACDTIFKGTEMRGAALLDMVTGVRLDNVQERGVRVSMLGISPEAESKLKEKLADQGINNHRVREALILASKTTSCHDIIAELCVSDNPDYTTGYIASLQSGYMRIPFIKEYGDERGGRVFFVKEGAHINEVINYLEDRPVMIVEIGD